MFLFTYFILVFAAKPDEYEFTMRKQNIVTSETFVKLRGLPYTCSVSDIEKFFEGNCYPLVNCIFSYQPLSACNV